MDGGSQPFRGGRGQLPSPFAYSGAIVDLEEQPQGIAPIRKFSMSPAVRRPRSAKVCRLVAPLELRVPLHIAAVPRARYPEKQEGSCSARTGFVLMSSAGSWAAAGTTQGRSHGR